MKEGYSHDQHRHSSLVLPNGFFIVLILCSCSPTTLAILNGSLRGLSNYHARSNAPRATVIQSVYNWGSFYLLEDTVIIANDGQPLGVITRNVFNPDSLINEFGRYGNKYNPNSIFNEFGRYGNVFSSLSPFNKFSPTPPKIYDKHGNFIAYFTANSSVSPRVEPVLLIAWLKSGT